MVGKALTTACALAAAVAGVATGCGDSDGRRPPAGSLAAPAVEAFPRPAAGQPLGAFARSLDADRARLTLLTSAHPAGHARLAFTVERGGGPVAGPTVLYAAPAADHTELVGPLPAHGTALATVDSARTTVYEVAAVDLHHSGRYDLLTLTDTARGPVAGRARIVARPPGGARRAAAPRRPTPALTVGAPLRLPRSLVATVGNAPAALVLPGDCGGCPDLAAAVREPARAFGDRVAVVEPAPPAERALRRALGLSPAPWLLTRDSRGRLAAFLEGAASPAAAERALQAAIVRGRD